jgi:hypothetical protein
MLHQPVAQALAPQKRSILPSIVLIVALLMAVAAAAFGFYEQSRTETVLIALKPLVYGQQITNEDLGTIEVPLHRPQQLAGITDAAAVVGKWASGDVRANEQLQPAMLLDKAPDQPVYPSGEELNKDMVVLPLSTETIGPLTHRDVLNIGFNDTTGDPTRCTGAGGTATPSIGVDGKPQPYACRLITGANVLFVDDATKIAYLELTPDAAHAVWSVQAAELTIWGERYGQASVPVPNMDRIDIGQVNPEMVVLPQPAGQPSADAAAPTTQPVEGSQP